MFGKYPILNVFTSWPYACNELVEVSVVDNNINAAVTNAIAVVVFRWFSTVVILFI
jgi:hypothetical protein